MSGEIPYAGATITFLDRNSGEKKAITYPITNIELTEFHDSTRELVAVRKFEVRKNEAGDDVWVEVPAAGKVMDEAEMKRILKKE